MDSVPEKGGKDRGGGSGWRGVENGVEEELPVVKKINSLINLPMDAPNNLPSLLPGGHSFRSFCPLNYLEQTLFLKKHKGLGTEGESNWEVIKP